MLFYIATRLERAHDHQKLHKLLKLAGHRCTYDWTVHGSVKDEGRKRIAEVAVLETEGVQTANFVVGLLPGGRGTHCELGMAIALHKHVYLHSYSELGFFGSDDRTCAFYHHPNCSTFTGPLDAFVRYLLHWESAQPVRKQETKQAKG